jgi:hypothetical protein
VTQGSHPEAAFFAAEELCHPARTVPAFGGSKRNAQP